MADFAIKFSAADLPIGPFGNNREVADDWLAEAAIDLRDTMTERCNEILQGYIQQEIALGNLTDEPAAGEEDFWDEFPSDAEEPTGAVKWGHWGFDPAHPFEDWQGEVANGDTRLGYWDWVAVQKELD